MASLPCKCGRPVEVVPSDLFDPIAAMQVFNRELSRRGEKLLARNEVVLCERCEPAWKATRAALQSKYTQRSREEWLRYKATVESSGKEIAERQMPRWWATDGTYQDLRKAWHQKHGGARSRKGDAY